MNAGPLVKKYSGEAVFTEFNETSQAHDQIEKCGFTDSEDQRRQFIQAPASEPTGLKLIENHDASGKLVGTLEVAQRAPGVYATSCTLPGERPQIPHGGAGGGGIKDAGLVEQLLHGVPQHGTVLGDPKAKVSVVEFSDLQCPPCKDFAVRVAPGLVSDVVRKGKATYDFRPLALIGPESADAAKAALAAGEQDRYWDFVELFFRNQGAENSGYVTDAFLESVARGAGVRDIAKWSQDRQSSKWRAVLAGVKSKAGSLGISGVPTIVVEGPRGRRILGPGVTSLAQIEGAIQAVG